MTEVNQLQLCTWKNVGSMHFQVHFHFMCLEGRTWLLPPQRCGGPQLVAVVWWGMLACWWDLADGQEEKKMGKSFAIYSLFLSLNVKFDTIFFIVVQMSENHKTTLCKRIIIEIPLKYASNRWEAIETFDLTVFLILFKWIPKSNYFCWQTAGYSDNFT